MAKLLLVLLAVCVVPSIVAYRFNQNTFMLQGCVYCDTCRCGYETEASKPIAGAVVKVECRSRVNSELKYTKFGVTDSAGKYKILVDSDHGDEVCDAALVKSSDPECATPDAGRDRARVILTRNNGMSSNTRFANPMGFLRNKSLASCPQILQKYQESDED